MTKQECIPVGFVPPACCPCLLACTAPVGCIPPACCPYLPACTAPGEGVYLPRGGVPSQGCTCSGGYLAGGVPGWGCTCLGGVPTQGVYLPRGCTCPGDVPAQGGICPGITPPLDRMTGTCKNTTFQTSFAGGNNYILFMTLQLLKQ